MNTIIDGGRRTPVRRGEPCILRRDPFAITPRSTKSKKAINRKWGTKSWKKNGEEACILKSRHGSKSIIFVKLI